MTSLSLHGVKAFKSGNAISHPINIKGKKNSAIGFSNKVEKNKG